MPMVVDGCKCRINEANVKRKKKERGMCGLIISCLVILQSRGLDMAAEEKKKKKECDKISDFRYLLLKEIVSETRR